MDISVIMLTYNRENIVSIAIESILAQTYRSFEFIIVDNGSTDRSGIIAEEYARKDSRICVIHKKRGNIGSGRNAGLDAAQGKYITFIDDDDYAEPDLLEFLRSLIKENKADISICGAFDSIYDEKRVMTAQETMIELLWRKKINVRFPTKLIRRELFEGVRFSETSKYDDIELTPKIITNANQVAYYGLPKYTFVRHENNNSAWSQKHELLDSETLSEYLRVYRERTEWLCSIYPGNTAMWKYFEWSFIVSMVEKVTRLNILDCYQLRDIMLKTLNNVKSEFSNCEWIQDFEKEWIQKYVRQSDS